MTGGNGEVIAQLRAYGACLALLRQRLDTEGSNQSWTVEALRVLKALSKFKIGVFELQSSGIGTSTAEDFLDLFGGCGPWVLVSDVHTDPEDASSQNQLGKRIAAGTKLVLEIGKGKFISIPGVYLKLLVCTIGGSDISKSLRI